VSAECNEVGIKKNIAGANQDANTWKVVSMRSPATCFKVVDDAGKNIITNFSTAEAAQKYIDDSLAASPPPSPPSPAPTGDHDQFGILKIAPDAPGGRFETKFTTEFKTRNYSSGKPSEPTVEVTNNAGQAIKNQEFTIAFMITKFKNKDDTASMKILGGRHSSSNPKTGTCYDCQLSVFGSTNKMLEVERPHPSMHACHKLVKNFFTLGESIVNKWIVMKTVTYTTNGGKDRHIEMQIGFPVTDINKPEEITFRKYWEVDDTGQLPSGHIIEPIGPLSTLRIDGVKKNGIEVKYASVREITSG
jgi:hypothetical protein